MGFIVDDITKQRNKGRGHVLLFPLAAPGHFHPFVQLLYTLDAECPGLIVTIAAPVRLLEQSVNLQSNGDFRNIDLRVEDIPGVIPVYEKDAKFPVRADHISEQNYRETEPLRKKLTAQKNSGSGEAPTSIISDLFYFWCKDFADELGIPWYSYFLCHPISTLMMLEFPKVIKAGVDPRTATNKDEDQLLLTAVPDHVATAGLSVVRTMDMGADMFDSLEFFSQLAETSTKAAGLILNTAEELDASSGVIPAMKTLLGPARVLSIGPSIQIPKFGRVYSSVPTDAVTPWLNSQRKKSVIYVAFGSTGVVSKELISELAAGLEASGAPFLWVLRIGSEKPSAVLPQGFEERTAGRGLIATNWVSQTSILQHPAVGAFLSHCGWNSILESICSSVPFIAIPVSADQLVGARYIHELTKVGIAPAYLKDTNKHDFGDITRREIELAIRKLLLEEEGHQLRANVTELQRLATKAVQRGGSSNKNLHKLLSRITNF